MSQSAKASTGLVFQAAQTLLRNTRLVNDGAHMAVRTEDFNELSAAVHARTWGSVDQYIAKLEADIAELAAVRDKQTVINNGLHEWLEANRAQLARYRDVLGEVLPFVNASIHNIKQHEIVERARSLLSGEVAAVPPNLKDEVQS